MLRFLHAKGPAPDRAARMMLYGQFVGSWDGTVVVHEADGARRESSCQVHFGWALEGRRQWLFTEITAESFHWLAREAAPGGEDWKILAEFFLRRRAAASPSEPANREMPEQRAFDFWIGDWVVTDPATGDALGESRIERILGGRSLHERWTGADGVSGESLNIYDGARQVWHQSWVDQTGALLLLDGGLSEGSMKLQGRDPAGRLQRIRWTPAADGSVMQHWERSRDEGSMRSS